MKEKDLAGQSSSNIFPNSFPERGMSVDLNLVLGLGFAALLAVLVIQVLLARATGNGTKKKGPTLFIDCDDTLYRSVGNFCSAACLCVATSRADDSPFAGIRTMKSRK
jgi:hypothetical protein